MKKESIKKITMYGITIFISFFIGFFTFSLTAPDRINKTPILEDRIEQYALQVIELESQITELENKYQDKSNIDIFKSEAKQIIFFYSTDKYKPYESNSRIYLNEDELEYIEIFNIDETTSVEDNIIELAGLESDCILQNITLNGYDKIFGEKEELEFPANYSTDCLSPKFNYVNENNSFFIFNNLNPDKLYYISSGQDPIIENNIDIAWFETFNFIN